MSPTVVSMVAANGTQPSGTRALNGPRPVDWSRFWSDEANRRTSNMLGTLMERFTGLQGVVALHGGLPPPEAFPVAALALTERPGLEPQGPLPAKLSGFAIDVPTTVALAQQYNLQPRGYPPLVAWASSLVARFHAPPCPVETVITSGATQAIDLATRCLLNPGDSILCEEYTFAHALECIFTPQGLRPVPVAMDGQGLDPAALRGVLAAAHAAWAGGKGGAPAPPRVLYTIPTGHNPTGAVMSAQRKREIYQVCQEFDVLILEDDAYWFLQFPNGPSAVPGAVGLPAGFLSLDTDGRVIRIDTFSKALGPGYRVGWVTAAPPIAAKLCMAVSAASVGASSLPQVVLHELLSHWGDEGLDAFLRRLQGMYGHKAAFAESCARRYLTGLADWQPAKAGMFMWLKLVGIDNFEDVMSALVERKVVVVPGAAFSCTPQAPCPFFRLSFATASNEQVEEGFSRLRDTLLERRKALGAPN